MCFFSLCNLIVIFDETCQLFSTMYIFTETTFFGPGAGRLSTTVVGNIKTRDGTRRVEIVQPIWTGKNRLLGLLGAFRLFEQNFRFDGILSIPLICSFATDVNRLLRAE